MQVLSYKYGTQVGSNCSLAWLKKSCFESFWNRENKTRKILSGTLLPARAFCFTSFIGINSFKSMLSHFACFVFSVPEA